VGGPGALPAPVAAAGPALRCTAPGSVTAYAAAGLLFVAARRPTSPVSAPVDSPAHDRCRCDRSSPRTPASAAVHCPAPVTGCPLSCHSLRPFAVSPRSQPALGLETHCVPRGHLHVTATCFIQRACSRVPSQQTALPACLLLSRVADALAVSSETHNVTVRVQRGRTCSTAAGLPALAAPFRPHSACRSPAGPARQLSAVLQLRAAAARHRDRRRGMLAHLRVLPAGKLCSAGSLAIGCRCMATLPGQRHVHGCTRLLSLASYQRGTRGPLTGCSARPSHSNARGQAGQAFGRSLSTRQVSSCRALPS